MEKFWALVEGGFDGPDVLSATQPSMSEALMETQSTNRNQW